MSRPSKPTALKLIQGNPGKRKINKNEPKPKPVKLTAPAYLSTWAKRRFNYYANLLAKSNITTNLDTAALGKLVEVEEEYYELNEAIKQSGITQKTTNSNGDPVIKPNPAVPARADAWRRVKIMLTEFGLTPASRSKVDAEAPDNDNDPLAKYGL